MQPRISVKQVVQAVIRNLGVQDEYLQILPHERNTESRRFTLSDMLRDFHKGGKVMKYELREWVRWMIFFTLLYFALQWAGVPLPEITWFGG